MIDTDADVVLISGPNGYGKTSFLEALLLLLSGWHQPEIDPVSALLSQPTNADGVSSPGACRLSCDIAMSDESKKVLDLGWGHDHQGALPLPGLAERDQMGGLTRSGGALASRLRNEADGLSGRELEARLTAFFQDRVAGLFDQAASGRTIRDVLEPFPVEIMIAQDRILPSLKRRLDDELQSEIYGDDWKGRPIEDIDRELAAAWRELGALLRKAENLRIQDWPTVPDAPDFTIDDRWLHEFARNVVAKVRGQMNAADHGRLQDEFASLIRDSLQKAIVTAEREARGSTEETEQLLAELEGVQARLESIRSRFPTLDEDVRRFASDDPALPDALGIFRSLVLNAQGWGRALAADISEMQDVRTQFASVSIDEAAKCVELLDAFLRNRIAVLRERADLQKEEAVLTARIDRSRMSDRLARLRDLERQIEQPLRRFISAWETRRRYSDHLELAGHRQRARDSVSAAGDAIDRCAAVLTRLTGPSQSIMEGLRVRFHQILRRFCLVDGILPIGLVADERDLGGQLRRAYRIRTADGRGLEHLSTGQRAQAAVSLLVAQNLAVSTLLPYRVILLDDVTTAYDLSNLTREALLWRQLAYGEGERNKRQVFISSHHEDLSNHLLDLLAPPHGCSMRLVRFSGWSQQTGPTYEVCEVEANARPPIDDIRNALAEL